jgi:hypothetical protein
MWTDRRFAGEDKLYISPPRDIHMRVPDIVMKSAVFLGRDTEMGRRYVGTGFLVLFHRPQRAPILFLVTAAHVAEELDGFDFYMRANRKDGVVAEPIQTTEHTLWWFHPTERESVDVAAMLLPFRTIMELDINPIPVPMFINESTIKEKNIGVGDEVFIAGLFTNAQGTSKHIPIVRIGNVAMMPGEKIFFPTEGKADQWLYANLLESRSTGGLSGSPVFVRETVRYETFNRGGKMRPAMAAEESGEPTEISALGRFHFFGSMIGHWRTSVPGELTSNQLEAVNMGIAPMVPAHKILEVLTQPGLVNMMNKIDDEAKKRRAKEDGDAVLDSTSNPEHHPLTEDEFVSILTKVTRKITPEKK